MGDYSRILIPDATFAEGAGRILDFSDSLNAYNFSETPEAADALAAWADWCAVAGDLNAVFRRYGIERGSCHEAPNANARPR